MKKRLCALLLSAVMAASLMTGCQASKGVENEYVKILQYKDVEIDQIAAPAEVTDKQVEKAIDEKRQAAKTSENITDRPAQQFDTVNINFVGTKDGEEFEGGSFDNYDLELGSDTFIDGFEDSVIGHNVGDTYTWDCTFPEDYGNTDLAGQEASFEITLNSITVYHVPELNDEFVQSVSSSSKTVEEYQKEMKETLEKKAEEKHTKELGQKVWEKIDESAEIISYPEDKVAAREQMLMDQYTAIAEDKDIELEEVAKTLGYKDLDDFKGAITDAVQQYLSQILITQAIADKEGIKVTDDILDAELQKIVDEYGSYYGYSTVEEMKASEDEEGLKDVVLKNLVLDWLGKHCIQIAK